MTHEDKQLLLKDLCARIHYGVMIKDTYSGHYGRLVEIGNTFAYFISKLNSNTLDVQLYYVKPYLRPMSSMTKKEKNEATQFEINNLGPIGCNWNLLVSSSSKLVDWLNAHYFDYRGLINKGLAIEAPEDMYKIN